jgi:aspartyl-tRNA synthetase
VRLQAWVHRRRDLGGLIFLNLRDRSGNVQVVVRPEEAAEVAAALAEVRQEWVVEVEGEVARREPAAVNPEMATGEVEIVADAAQVLSRSAVPPFTPDAKVEASEDTRLRYRYLDLRRADLQRNMILRHKATLEVLNYFDEEGFVNVETPILTRSTPEGARDYLVPSRVHRGEFYAMPQSPQLFKQILMVSGLERYVQIARCFRDEDLRADRQPEFTQIDVEISFADEEEVIAVIEGMFSRLFPLVGVDPAPPFRRLTWADAMARYGSDRPDLRCPLEIADLGDVLGESGFRGFRQAVEEGGVVRGLAVPGAAAASRRIRDAWADLARSQGAAGVLTLTRRDGELAFQVKNVLTDAELAAVAERSGLEEGGAVLLAAGAEKTTAAALGALRLAVAREYGHLDETAHEFTWVTEFPLLDWDEDRGRWTSTHHPFTSPDPRDIDRLESDPGSVRSRAYDLVLNGVELGGGSIRIHQSEMQERVFAILGIGAEEARQRFGFLLEALSYGAPPHGGVAFGLDRIVMLMAGAGSLRDVIAFPKTTSATDLMTAAPSPVDADQLAELGLEIAARRGDEN